MNLVHCATRASCATRSDNHKGFYRRHTDVRLVEVNKLDRKQYDGRRNTEDGSARENAP